MHSLDDNYIIMYRACAAAIISVIMTCTFYYCGHDGTKAWYDKCCDMHTCMAFEQLKNKVLSFMHSQAITEEA